MTTQMTRLELETRCKQGEDPLDLSIEKWNRIALFLKDGGDPDLVECGWDTCGLCLENGYKDGGDPDLVECGWDTCGLCLENGYKGRHGWSCDGCRYLEYYDQFCWEVGTAFDEFVSELGSGKDLHIYAEEMRDELIAIKEAECKD